MIVAGIWTGVSFSN